MLHRIVELKTLPGLRLFARFDCGGKRRYSIAPLLPHWPAFRPLRDVPGLFDAARIDSGGLGVVWNDEIDVASDEIWENGTDLMDEEKHIVAEGLAKYDADPDSFISLADFKASQQ